jgi:NADH dehydrogenase
MKGIDVIYHLAGTERKGSRADLNGVDVEGTQILSQVAAQAGVERLIYLSHIGADRASAYPVFKAKALAEGHIIRSGINYTIFRSSIIFGPNDQFTTSIAQLIRKAPGIFLLPGDGKTLLQPIWIEDLVTCLAGVLDDSAFINQIISIGGIEYYSFRQVVELVMGIIGIRRRFFSISPVYLRWFTLFIEPMFRFFPISIFWLDYLASNRTCPLDSLPRLFGLMPARLSQRLDYLKP